VIRAHMQYVSCLLIFTQLISILTTIICSCYWFLFATLGVAGFQMDGALVIDAKRDFRNQIMMYQAQQRLEPKIKLVKYVTFCIFEFIFNHLEYVSRS
jgi:hypothetical protein